MEHSFDLLSLQGIDVNLLSAPGYVAEWRAKGYTAILSPIDAATHSHRVALVSRVPCRPVKLENVQASSRVAAGLIEAQYRDHFEHVLVVAVYGFPGDEAATDVLIRELLQAIDRFGGTFLLIGDYNTTQHSGAVSHAIRQGQVHALDDASLEAQLPTNPLRTRRIDFGLSHRRLWADDIFNFETCFSDHKVVGYKLAVTLRSEVFRPPKFVAISSCSEECVRSKFEQLWQPQAFCTLLDRQDVDAAWALLSNLAEEAMAAEPAGARRSEAWQPSRQEARPQVVSSAGHESFTTRALRRLVNQLSQLKAKPSDPFLRRRIGRGLRQLRSKFQDLPYINLDSIEDVWEWATSLLQQVTDQEKQAAIARWQARQRDDQVATSAWVKRKADEATHLQKRQVSAPQDCRTVHPFSFLQREAAIWKDKWSRQGRGLDYDAIDTALKVLPEAEALSDDPIHFSVADMQRAARHMKHKACGPDSWSAGDLLKLPFTWWQAFCALWQVVYRRSCIPHQWKHITIVLIPKRGEESRPIGLCSIAWRIGAKVVNWRLRNWLGGWITSDTLGAAPGRGTYDAHVRLQRARANGVRQFIKQDLSSFFDTIDVRAATMLLERMGAPPALGILISEFYRAQRRIFKSERYYSSEWIQVSRGVVQGCPLSPTIALAFGHLWAQFCATPQTCRLIFIDDRVLWAKPGTLRVDQALAMALDKCQVFDRLFGFHCRAQKCAVVQPPGDTTLQALADERHYPCEHTLQILGVELQLDGSPDSLLKLQLDLVLCRLRYLRLCSASVRVKKLVYSSLVTSVLTWAAGVALPDPKEVARVRADTQAMLQPQLAKDAPFVLVWAAHGWQFEPQCVLNWRAVQVALRVVARPPVWLREEEPSGTLPPWQQLVPVAADVCRHLGWTLSQAGSAITRVDDYGVSRVFLPGVDHFRILRDWVIDAFKQKAILDTARVRQNYHRADPSRACGLALPRPAPNARYALLGHASLATDDNLAVRRAALASGGSGWYAAARKQVPRQFEVICCCGLKWPSRPHVTWNCACTSQFRSRLELPTDRAQERLFAAPLLELPAAPAAEPLGDLVPKLVQHLEALLRQDAEVVVATDGSSDEDVGAMAIVTTYADFACGDSAEDQSPFKFELLALLTLFRALVRVQASGRVRVLTDCQAAQQAVANPEACCLGVSAREAADLFRLLQSSRLSVSLHWVPSHNKQQSWVPPSGLLAGECRALNDKADSAANACRVCRAADSNRVAWHRDKRRAMKWECDVIFAAAQGSELLQEHVVNSAGTARRAAAAAAETDDAAVLGDDEGDSSGAGAVCAGSEAVGVYGVFEDEGVYGDSAAAAGPSSQASSAEGVYGDPAVAAEAEGVYGVFAAPGVYGGPAPAAENR